MGWRLVEAHGRRWVDAVGEPEYEGYEWSPSTNPAHALVLLEWWRDQQADDTYEIKIYDYYLEVDGEECCGYQVFLIFGKDPELDIDKRRYDKEVIVEVRGQHFSESVTRAVLQAVEGGKG